MSGQLNCEYCDVSNDSEIFNHITFTIAYISIKKLILNIHFLTIKIDKQKKIYVVFD